MENQMDIYGQQKRSEQILNKIIVVCYPFLKYSGFVIAAWFVFMMVWIFSVLVSQKTYKKQQLVTMVISNVSRLSVVMNLKTLFAISFHLIVCNCF